MSLDSYKCHCSFTLTRYIVASYPDLFQFLFILVLYVYRRDYIMNITLNGGGGEGLYVCFSVQNRDVSKIETRPHWLLC